MKEFIEILIGRLEEKSAYHQKYGDSNGYTFAGYEGAIGIVNQLAEEYGKDANVTTNILSELKKFLKEKVDYCAEQAEMNLEAECDSEIASYFRNRKELYLDRANIYGEVMREIDRLAEEYNSGWIPCSERLPEKNGQYLVQNIHGEICVAHYYYNSLCTYRAFFDGYTKVKNVIAWQTLPEPYKTEGE